MLNPKTGQRELAYVAKIGWVRPIEGADNIELVGVNGWTCIAKKGEFHEGDLAVYFEIDSKLPERDWSEFLAAKHYKVKTMKLGKFKVISQGLALPAEAFGWELGPVGQFAGDGPVMITKDKNFPYFAEGDFLTEYLGVTYSVEEDNKRKAKINPDAKINAALQRHPKIAKKYGKLIKKNKFFRWIFLAFFGRNVVKDWPAEVRKTDEERIENRPRTLEDKTIKWVATEKIDGSSSTFHLRRGKFGHKAEYFVCSRNVVFNTPEKENNNYYTNTIGNIWVEMNAKYNMRDKLEMLLMLHPTAEWVTVQAETFGAGVQKRDYGMKDRELRAFNLIFSDTGRVGTVEMKKMLDEVDIPSVPILAEEYVLPDTIDELRAFVHGEKSKIDGGMREGIVFRSQDGTDSFKCVDPEFLLKYHQ